MAGMPGIVIQIGADTKDAIDGINRLTGKLGDSLSNTQKFKAGLDKAFVPALAALAGLGAAGVAFAKAAADDAQQADILAKALRNSAGASDRQVKSTEDWITAQGNALGIADDQLRPALGFLARATGSVSKAQSLASTAMDISAATGSDLTAVSKALAKATTGSTGALSKLVPGMDAAILKSGDMAAIQAELARVVGGSAAASANSAAGQMQRFSLAMKETGESIGAALLPILQAVLPYLQQFGAWAQEHTGVLIAIGVAVGVVAGAIVVLKIAMEAWTVVQWLLNSALLANPITWIVIAIIAFVAAIVLAYNKVDWFKNFIDTAWTAIQTAVGAVVEWFQTNVLPALKAVWEGIGKAIAVVVAWFKETAWPAIQAVLDILRPYFEASLKAVGDAWTILKAGIAVVANWIRDTLWPIIETAIGWIRSAFEGYFRIVGTGWAVMKAAIEIVANWIRDTLVPFIAGQIAIMSAGWEALSTGVQTVWNGILTFISGLVAKFTAIGTSVVEGIKSGFLGPWNAFLGWVGEQVNKLPDVAKKVLGINSPSRVFAALGSSVVEGWQLGLNPITDVNSALANSLTDAVTGQNAAMLSAGESLGAAVSRGFSNTALLSPSVGGTSATGTRTVSAAAAPTEEQLVRALWSLLARSDLRNGRTPAVA